MKANPGGHPDPDDIRGRDRLIAWIWERLESQSLLMNAERRIGKTQILRKMLAQPRPGWQVRYADLERINSVQEFAEEVYDRVQEFLGTGQRATNFLRDWMEKFQTDQVSLEARTWKELLTTALSDLFKTPRPDRILFLWDEFPYMVENIRQAEGPGAAAMLLDVLRSLRVKHPEFRAIHTGSIGLHHVLDKLAAAGHTTSGKNDLYPMTVEPLDPADAQLLAADLLLGEGLECADHAKVAETIAAEVDRVPYYIHHVVAGLRYQHSPGRKVTVEGVREYVARQLVDAADPWQLAHYRTRLSKYYGDERAAKSELVLDVVALLSDQAKGLTVDEIFHSVDTRPSVVLDSREELLRLLRDLTADHYFARDDDGRYRFRFSLVRRWWQLDRGL
jgi:hypothetical protein